MKTNTIALNYKGFRFLPEIISHAVWLSFRFSLSFRDIEERTTHSAGSWYPMKRFGSAA
jgi:transposase-like protein